MADEDRDEDADQRDHRREDTGPDEGPPVHPVLVPGFGLLGDPLVDCPDVLAVLAPHLFDVGGYLPELPFDGPLVSLVFETADDF